MKQFRFVMGSDRYDDCAAFYGQLLELPVFDEWADPTRGTIWQFSDGLIEVAEPPAGERAAAVTGVFLAIEVDDAQVWHDRLTGRGAVISSPLTTKPWGHHSFGVVDPHGLELVLFEVVGQH